MKTNKKVFVATLATATLVAGAGAVSAEELVKLTPVGEKNLEAYKVEVQSDKIDSMKLTYEEGNKLVVTSGKSVQELEVGDATYYFVRDNGQGITKATSIMQGGRR